MAPADEKHLRELVQAVLTTGNRHQDWQMDTPRWKREQESDEGDARSNAADDALDAVVNYLLDVLDPDETNLAGREQWRSWRNLVSVERPEPELEGQWAATGN